MEPLVLFPDPPNEVLTQTLDQAGYPWKAAATADMATRIEPEEGWAGAVIDATRDAEAAFGLCRTFRKRDIPLEPLLILVPAHHLAELELREDLFDDFCVAPWTGAELEARLKHLFWRSGGGTRPELIEYGVLVLNLETYQAAISGRPLDLTYMEYELLKYLASHPGKVFTARDAALTGLGLRVLRRCPHGRRPHPTSAGQARRGAREPDPDRALGRLPLRPVPLGGLTIQRQGDLSAGVRLSRPRGRH